VVALLAGLAFPTDGGAQNGQDKNKKPPPKNQGPKANPKPAPKLTPGQQAAQQVLAEAAILREAFGLLAAANHNYDGHRLHALREVRHAIEDLDGHVGKLGNASQKALSAKGRKAVADADRQARQIPPANEPQATSNKQLRQAKEILESRRGVLAQYKLTKALGHVNKAIREIGDALVVAVTHLHLHEARRLREAFVLLAGANHDYGGERVRAMEQVKAALGRVDEFVLKHGNAAQKDATHKGRESVREAEAAAASLAMVNQPQPASDKQLQAAREILVAVRGVLGEHGQQAAQDHTQRAVRHVSLALKIN
jgi:hypothetical protein